MLAATAMAVVISAQGHFEELRDPFVPGARVVPLTLHVELRPLHRPLPRRMHRAALDFERHRGFVPPDLLDPFVD